MFEFISDFVEQLAIAADTANSFAEVTHEGPPARYTMFATCPCGCSARHHNSVILTDGQSIQVNRSARLLVEPMDRLRARPVAAVLEQWVTQ